MKPPLIISGLVFPLTLLVVGVGYGATYGADRLFPQALVDETSCYGGGRSTPRLPADDVVSGEIRTGSVADNLRGFRERPLSADAEVRTLRFVWSHSFGSPVLVRIDTSPGGEAWLRALRMGGCSGDACALSRRLTTEEQALIDRLQAAAFARAADDCSLGADGDHWFFEAAGGGEHHLMRRWSPPHGPEYELGVAMLALTHWRFEVEPTPGPLWGVPEQARQT